MVIFDGVREALDIAREALTLEAMRERLAYAKVRLADVEKEFAELKAENADLLRENYALCKHLESLLKNDEYLDLTICALQKNPAGGYFATPLCSRCKKPFMPYGLGSNPVFLRCISCSAMLRKSEVESVVHEALSGHYQLTIL